jgi:hypothetical protein
MSYANSHSVESSINGTSTIQFPWPVREVQITNDSPTNSLQFKLNETETFRTLQAFETATLTNVRITELYLSSTASVTFRIWGLG